MRTPSFRAAVTAVAVATLTSLAACSNTDSGESKAAPTELVLSIGGEDDEGYDPTVSWGRYGHPLFQSTLLTRESDLSVGNDLATDHRVSKDGLTWTVDIRTDATFSDGEPVTASDVAYTFTTASKTGGLADLTALEEATAVDEDTVEFRLTKPRSTFINRLVTLGIVPEHAHDEKYAQQPIGSGPFTFVEWQKGQQLVVERNDDYYGEKPQFERITFLFTDEDATLAAAKAGQVHVAGLPSLLAKQDIDGMDLKVVTSVDNRGMSMPYVPNEGRKAANGAPIGNDVTSDVAVRRAINVAVDRQALVDGVLEGFGSPAHGPADGTPWAAEGTEVSDGDPKAAARILAEAGWKDSDGDGVVEKDGTRATFTLLYPAGDTLRQGLALGVVDMIGAAGIEVKTEGAGWEEIEKRMHSDSVLFGWGSHDPTEVYNLYASAEAGNGYNNPGFFSDPAVDKHLDAAMGAVTPEQANEHWKAAELDAEGNGYSAKADAGWIWLTNLEHTYFVDSCLDLGEVDVEPHGHGWPITSSLTQWKWTC